MMMMMMMMTTTTTAATTTTIMMMILMMMMIIMIIIVVVVVEAEVIVVVVVVVVITLKGAIREFFTLSSTRTLLWPGRNRVQISCSTYSAYRVQHVVCYEVRRDSSAIKFDRVGIAFILSLFYWLNL